MAILSAEERRVILKASGELLRQCTADAVELADALLAIAGPDHDAMAACDLAAVADVLSPLAEDAR